MSLEKTHTRKLQMTNRLKSKAGHNNTNNIKNHITRATY